MNDQNTKFQSNEALKPGFLVAEVNGSVCPNCLKLHADNGFTYKTPQSIIDYINMNAILSNPPYDTATKIS